MTGLNFRPLALAAAIAAAPAFAHAQEQDLGWSPQGPVTMLIAFAAGGGADSLARLLAEELNARYDWEVIPQNVTGRGGVVMAQHLAGEPADGMTVGVSVSEATTYAVQAARDPGFDVSSFDYLSTITGTQMGIIAKADRGWDNIGDVIEAAKSGEQITVGSMTQKLADATYVLGKNNGIEFTNVMTSGGRGGMNAVIADDVDIAWSAGAQAQGVEAGDLINLTSAEAEPLQVSPDAPMIGDFNFDYDMGVMFLVMAPAGLPEDAKTAWATAIETIVTDEETQINALTNRAFSGPQILNGEELSQAMQESYDAAGRLLDESAE
ncbi:tripartite tricarboxylate transporter substrate-binding protein [Roseicyclus sp. F158]|uniref:Tripartite tricarboxylate transporter substrate-binding protein n=1 Tax=Tropicimonas omnivorans TaxID=3075590 RepID=A0ABU3DKC6_9RHOB|nr:tripartite tricarboxylate transporter substrate-binding protein [Roseicyclus sp. F158]MDT0683562.1 tripartite tricarboxylate transporter substrate-binding protein [Roseicyclus sp. F158]